MSDRNWRSKLAFGRSVAFFRNPLFWVGLVIMGMLVCAGYLERHPANGALGAVEAQTQQTKAQQTSVEDVASRVNPVRASEYQPDCSDAKNADLCAQRRMAKAAEDQINLNWLGLVLLFGTLVFTGWAAVSTRSAASHTARAVDIQIRIEQPLLYVEGIQINLASDVLWRVVELTVQNLGKTPAILVAHSLNAKPLQDFTPQPIYTDETDVRGAVIRSETDIRLQVLSLDQQTCDTLSSGDAVLLYGYFRYEDVFGRTRTTGFGYRGHTNRLAFAAYGSIAYSWDRLSEKSYNYDREEPQT